MFRKISNNLILFGIVAMSFVLTNNAFAASDVNYAFSGESTGSVLGGRDYNDSYFNNNPYLYNIGNTNYAASKLNDVTGPNTKTNTNTTSQNPTVVNNYYYNTPTPATGSSTKTATSSTSKTTDTSNNNQTVATTTGTKVASASTSGYGRYDSVPLAREVGVGRSTTSSPYSNSLGASVYGATGYSSVSFMPSTFLGWFLLALLIAAIIVVYRLIVRKNRRTTTVVVKA